MRVQDITSLLDRLAPPSYQASYDNAGLLVGQPDWSIEKVLVTLDVTEAVVREAKERRAGLIVAHHPIIFGGLKRLTGATYVERVVMAALEAKIAIYAAHTNLDSVRQGVNDASADKMGLLDRRILAPEKGDLLKLVTFVPTAQADALRLALFEAGAGQIGQYDSCSFNLEGTGTFRAGQGAKPFVGAVGQLHREPETRVETVLPKHLERAIVRALRAAHPYEEVAFDLYPLANENPMVGAGMVGRLPHEMPELEFLALLKREFRVGAIRHTALLGKPIREVALCGGAGSFLRHKAIASGAQAYVSADFKYHEFFDAEGRILLADIGHFESEQFTIGLLCSMISEKFPTFACLPVEKDTNPITYF